MGFIKVSFHTDRSFAEILNQLDLVGCVEILGDWHEHRLKNVVRNGLAATSPPAQSIQRDRLKNGPAVLVELRLTTGKRIAGQIRQRNILLGDRAIDRSLLVSDVSTHKLIDAIRGFAAEVEVEVG